MIPLGAFSWGKFDLLFGKMALTAYYMNQYRASDQRSGDKLDVGTKIGIIWGTGVVYRAGGWGLRVIAAPLVANPVTVTVTYAYVAGAITADAMDPEQGLDNYLGFTSGGQYGNNPNYLRGDANDSGYFNVVQNFANILKAKRRAKDRKKQKELEAAYIRDYWVNNHLETLTQQWLAMTPEEQSALRDFTTQ